MTVLHKQNIRGVATCLLPVAVAALLVSFVIFLDYRSSESQVHADGPIRLATSLRVAHRSASDLLTISGHVSATGIPVSGAGIVLEYRKANAPDKTWEMDLLAAQVNRQGDWRETMPLQLPRSGIVPSGALFVLDSGPGRYDLIAYASTTTAQATKYKQHDVPSATVTVNLR